jgi:hypothetical protein
MVAPAPSLIHITDAWEMTAALGDMRKRTEREGRKEGRKEGRVSLTFYHDEAAAYSVWISVGRVAKTFGRNLKKIHIVTNRYQYNNSSYNTAFFGVCSITFGLLYMHRLLWVR